jgi:predicted transcriptional regulator
MSIKELALRTITDLAEDVSFHEIEDRIHFLAAIEKARQEVRRGEVVPHEDVRSMLKEWLTE